MSARKVAILDLHGATDIVKMRHTFLCNPEQHDVKFLIDHPDQRSGTYGLTDCRRNIFRKRNIKLQMSTLHSIQFEECGLPIIRCTTLSDEILD